MKVQQIMSPDPLWIGPQNNIREAAHLMADANIGSLLVGHPSNLQGVVTDRDIVVRGVARGLTPNDTPVHMVMNQHVVSCSLDDELPTALNLMAENRVRRLVVKNGQGETVGILSLDDIAVRSGEDVLISQALHRIAEETAVFPH